LGPLCLAPPHARIARDRRKRGSPTGARSDRSSSEPPTALPHQFRTKNGLNETQRTRSKSNENAEKSTKPIDTPPLITAWLPVRGLPHIPGNRPRLIFD